MPSSGAYPFLLATPIKPGTNIQTVVDAAPTGAAFLLMPGTHSQQSVTPKDGNVFLGGPGVIMDGGNVTAYAFRHTTNTNTPSHVTIRGIEIKGYVPATQMGAIKAGGQTAAEHTSGWVVEECNVHHNATGGIRIGHRMIVRSCNIHHNEQIGLAGVGDGTLIESNEIAYNNPSALGSWPDNGGFKFVQSNGLTIRGNYSHHNYDHGMWTDIDNINVVYENNVCSDNNGAGIFHEIGYAAIIRNNTCARNGFGRPDWLMGSGVLVAASRDVEIYGNTVDANQQGICAIQQARGSGAYGTHEIRNLYVHDNTVTMAVGSTGVAQDIGDTTVFTGWNVRYVHNTYNLGANPKYFSWLDAARTEGEWQGYGLDTTGTFNR